MTRKGGEVGMSIRNEIIERLENLAKHAIHRAGEPPLVMSLDDGIALHEAIELLKAQEVATVEPKRIELADETKAWLDKMDAVDALSNIADICIDWDGYRTADGLGGLVNEIWAYARYCANRLAKAQEPVEPIHDEDNYIRCGRCKHNIVGIIAQGTGNIMPIQKYCAECGQAVKWE